MIYQRLFKEDIVSKTQINEWINQINSDVKYLQGLLDKVVSQLEVCKKFLLVPFNKKQLPDLLKLDSLVKEFEKQNYERGYYYTKGKGYNFEKDYEYAKGINDLISQVNKTYKNEKGNGVSFINDLYTFTVAEDYSSSRWDFRWLDTSKNFEYQRIGFRHYTIDISKGLEEYFSGKKQLEKSDNQKDYKNHPLIHGYLFSVEKTCKSESNRFNQIKLNVKKCIQRLKSTGLFVDTKEMTIDNIPVIITVKKEENKPLIDQTVQIVTEIIQSLHWFKPYASKVKFIKILDDKKTLMSLYGRKGMVSPYAYFQPSTKEVFLPIVHEEKEIRFFKGTIKHELFHHVFHETFGKNETLFNELKTEVDKILKSNDPIYPSSYAYSYFKNPALAKKGVKTQYNEYCAEVMAYDKGSEFDELRKSIIGLI